MVRKILILLENCLAPKLMQVTTRGIHVVPRIFCQIKRTPLGMGFRNSGNVLYEYQAKCVYTT